MKVLEKAVVPFMGIVFVCVSGCSTPPSDVLPAETPKDIKASRSAEDQRRLDQAVILASQKKTEMQDLIARVGGKVDKKLCAQFKPPQQRKLPDNIFTQFWNAVDVQVSLGGITPEQTYSLFNNVSSMLDDANRGIETLVKACKSPKKENNPTNNSHNVRKNALGAVVYVP